MIRHAFEHLGLASPADALDAGMRNVQPSIEQHDENRLARRGREFPAASREHQSETARKRGLVFAVIYFYSLCEQVSVAASNRLSIGNGPQE